MANVKLTAVLLLVLALIVVPWTIAQSTQPATQPVVGQSPGEAPVRSAAPKAVDDGLSPAEVLVAAWRSGLAGDVDKHVAYFHNLTPAQETKQRKVAELLQVVQGLADAVTRKFGAAAGQQLFDSMGFGLNENALASANVVIDGDRATVDLGNAGPGAVPMIRTTGGWKVSPEVIDTFNDRQLDRIPAIKQMAKDIDDGKVTDPRQLQQAMRPPRR